MARITIHAGDFMPGPAWYYTQRGNAAPGGFVVRSRNNQPLRLAIADIGAVEPATPEWIRRLGGGEPMIDVLERLSDNERAGAFVARYSTTAG
jgi:hypothetical protein